MPGFRSLLDRMVGSFRPPTAEASVVASAPVLTLRQLVRRFWPDVRAIRGWFALSLVFVLVTPVLEAAEIWLFKLVVDQVLVPRNLSAFWPLAIAYVGFTLAEALVGFADTTIFEATTTRFLHRLRTRAFAHIHRLGPEYLERYRLGDLLTRISGDVSAIEALILTSLTDLISYAAQIVVFAGLLLYLDWRLALAAFVAAPLLVLVSKAFSRAIQDASRERMRRSGSVSAVAESSLRSARLVTAYGAQDEEVAAYTRESAVSIRAEMAATRIFGLYGPLVNLLELVGVLLVVWLGANELIAGRLTLGGILVFIAYMGQLYGPVRGMGSLGNSVFSAMAGGERLAELLDANPTIAPPASAVPLDEVKGELTLQGVTYTYPGATTPAVNAIDLRIAPGETVAVVGPSGSGKSTLVALLLRLIDPQHGSVTLDGTDLKVLDLDQLGQPPPWPCRTLPCSREPSAPT